ncbi:MAG: ABC transporter ATP-binding protein [Lachnospiraceae bacterium]|nr:ABC transporter ATP-binding protein [Lachnospiraceae bacterium]
MAFITVKDLSLGYDSLVIADHLNFKVEQGNYLCIVGENGSGKTTLMRTLLHLKEPVSGQILIGDGLKNNEIGYLPQQTLVQKDFPASVWEIVLSGCQGRCGLRPFYTKEEKKLAEENITRMGITELRNRCYRELSGGQQQRVLLARALCATGKVLLLDEPVAGLDPVVTAQMYELIAGLNREGITIIMVSHDIAAALRYASHILHIGDTVFFGTREEYMGSEVGKYMFRTARVSEKEPKNSEQICKNGVSDPAEKR